MEKISSPVPLRVALSPAPHHHLPCPGGNSGVVPNADPRPAAMAWKDDERFAVQAANVGLDIILCPAHFLYLDIVQDLNFEDKLLANFFGRSAKFF